MKRRVPVPNPHAARASGDRWLFGYADIVTLLLACFAGLYATGLAPAASPQPEPIPPAAEIVEVPVTPAPEIEIPPAVEEPTPLSALEVAFEDVVSQVLPGVEMTKSPRGLVISLPEAGSFPPGRADLSRAARSIMLDLADRLRELPNQIRIEGHTDDVPIANAQFASNWDLSTARATRVVELLIYDGYIDPTRLAAAGYAEFRPRLPNGDATSRARNRRVDIVVLDPAMAGQEDPGAVR